jgi:DNA-binding NarL/FixJ family response regulator
MAVSGISRIAVSKRVRYPPCVGETDAVRTTILIVDDNAQIRTLMREITAQEPSLHVVGEAEDGAGAICLAQALQPDLMLLDLVMPRVNGLEALRRIKAARPETKVIIVTVHDEDAYRQAAEASGADAFLLKKTLVTILLPTIRRLCDSLAR